LASTPLIVTVRDAAVRSRLLALARNLIMPTVST
jgi:hypothetical protein